MSKFSQRSWMPKSFISMPAALRTVLFVPSAPMRYLARTVRTSASSREPLGRTDTST